MKTPLTLKDCFDTDASLKRVFSWLTRIGAAPAFGSRPISWYQIHQCHAIDTLKAIAGENPLRTRAGYVEFKIAGQWRRSLRIAELFDIADKKSRS